ncbi:hypothetical protein SLE2022_225740 [Rubroshorea leprosula]
MGIREIVVAGTIIVIHELDDVYDSVTGRPLTGSWVWDSALVLSKWMFTQVDFQGKSVLEVGAGAGVPGLVAARLGASRVVLTDVKPLLPGLLKNVEANTLTDRVEVKELVWGSDESALGLSETGKFDIVLMSDVFFDPEGVEGLGRTLKMVCGDNTNIWAASELRPWTGECLNQLTTLGFGVVELPSEPSESIKGEDSNPFAIFHIALLAEEKCSAES